jgi:hypothetical protein
LRKLHPPGPKERLVAHGKIVGPTGVEETWTAHIGAGDRRILRVETADGGLWHLALSDDGRPERMQVRLHEGDATLDATWTFFPDEVLVWRRGGGTESVAETLPAGCFLLWPPYAGRGELLGALVDAGAAPLLCLWRVALAEGGLREALTVVDVRREGDAGAPTLVITARPDGAAMHEGPGAPSAMSPAPEEVASVVADTGREAWSAHARLGRGGLLKEWRGPEGKAVELVSEPAVPE